MGIMTAQFCGAFIYYVTITLEKVTLSGIIKIKPVGFPLKRVLQNYNFNIGITTKGG